MSKAEPCIKPSVCILLLFVPLVSCPTPRFFQQCRRLWPSVGRLELPRAPPAPALAADSSPHQCCPGHMHPPAGCCHHAMLGRAGPAIGTGSRAGPGHVSPLDACHIISNHHPLRTALGLRGLRTRWCGNRPRRPSVALTGAVCICIKRALRQVQPALRIGMCVRAEVRA
jgi:hypothetical protein